MRAAREKAQATFYEGGIKMIDIEGGYLKCQANYFTS